MGKITNQPNQLIMNDTEIRKEVDAFVALPRAERREKYSSLSKPVQLRARKIIEARRGIAYRAEGGVMVLTKERYIQNILDSQNKAEVVLPKRIEASKARVVELKRQLQENYGDEAIEEVENLLEEQAEANKK